MIKNSLLKTFFSILVYTSLISALLVITCNYPIYSQKMSIIDDNSSDSILQKNDDLIRNGKQGFDFNNQVLSTNSLNDIASARITCYLHLRTTQIQLDINFVGVDSDSPSETKSRFYTSQEEISVFGEIRGVQIIEANTIELDHYEEVIGNSTKIQFALSSEIPVGLVRNVKITYLQDTKDFLTHYNYELGVNWLRRIGNQNVIIICDREISLLKCVPPPHSISTVSNKLVLSWLEVNRYDFFADINYTSLIVIDDLEITPSEWDAGRIRKDSEPMEKVFTITNFENQKLDGSIIKPDWVDANITDWELNIGETMYLKIIIDRSTPRNFDCNISLQCSLVSFPVNIQISGKIAVLSTGAIVAIILSAMIFGVSTAVGIVYYYKKNYVKSDKLSDTDLIAEEDIIDKIDFDKWKEILTEREFTIFQIIIDKTELTQADLVRQTALSKSTVSRAVGRLIVKGLVKKEKYGMSNIVSLNTEFFKNN
ncbi:MAG: MarR family transcriptional regulator [Asgard group archaeon]|nr:MarR family transcriptional regulator [Asgard group archaeon]